MKLLGVEFNGKEFKIPKPKYSLFGGSLFSPYGGHKTPEIILTKKEAKERGINPTGKYYFKVNKQRVLLTIKNDKKGGVTTF